MKILIIASALVAMALANDYEQICGKDVGYFFVKDPSDCQNYFLCKDGEAILDRCPDGYLFNETATLCDYAENVICSAPTPPPPPMTCPPTGQANLPIPGECTKYIFCVDGEEHILHCANGTLFDESYRKCKDQVYAKCNECPLEDGEKPVFVPDRKDCRRYFFCKNRQQHIIHCGKRLYFDETDSTCKNTCEGNPPFKCPYEDATAKTEYCK